jgi:DNA polymerase-3 subunit delta
MFFNVWISPQRNAEKGKMPIRRPKDLSQALKHGKIEPVYLLFGPETQLRDEAARAIADEALRDTLLREFNDASFSLANGDARPAIAAAEQLPMMSSGRVVRITDFTKLDEANEAMLLRYLDRPVESSVILFMADDIDKRKKLTKRLMQCAAFEFAPLNDAELAAWARARLKELGTEADANVLRCIVELVGQDVRRLSHELNKLSAAALPSGKITMELVEALVSRSRELVNWELTDQMLARNRSRAMETLRHLLDDGAQPVVLIGLIASNYRRMALAQSLLAQGVSPREIFRQVPMPPFKQNSFLARLNRTDGRTLARQIARIAEADLGIKTSTASPRLQVEVLVCELMS